MVAKKKFNIEKHFDRYADKLERSTLSSKYKAHKIIPGELLKVLDKGSTVLDLGVGTGLSSRCLIKKSFNVIGMDISKELLKIASKYNYQSLIKQDITKRLKIKKNSCDAVMSVGVFDFFNDFNHIFTEVKRVLKNQGYFTFTMIKHQTVDYEITFSHTKKEIKEICKKYNFKIIRELEFFGYGRVDYSAIYYGFVLQNKG